MPRKTDGQVAITLRLREDLRDRLADAAKAGDTSLNSEIVTRLGQSMSEQTLLGGNSTASAMRALATEIANVEQRTGKSWREDVRTFYAAQEVILIALGRFAPPVINQDRVSAASERWESARNVVKGQLEYLNKVGAIEKIPHSSNPLTSTIRPRGMFGLFSSPTDSPLAQLLPSPIGDSKAVDATSDYGRINDALRHSDYQIRIDLDASLDTWALHGPDGSPMPDAEKVAVRAMLMGFPAYHEQEQAMARAWSDEYAPHFAEREAGRKLADEIVGYKIPRAGLLGGMR